MEDAVFCLKKNFYLANSIYLHLSINMSKNSLAYCWLLDREGRKTVKAEKEFLNFFS